LRSTRRGGHRSELESRQFPGPNGDDQIAEPGGFQGFDEAQLELSTMSAGPERPLPLQEFLYDEHLSAGHPELQGAAEGN
jgi:hypothetical protein